MKADDLEKMKVLFPEWKKLTSDVKTICVHSPAGGEIDILSELFPMADISRLGESTWNLLKTAPQKFDLFVTNNTFMYSTDPQAWFDNIMASCRYAWIQDVIRGRRDPERECGNDGDRMRFKYEPRASARLPEAYDLHKLDKMIVKFDPFDSTGAGHYDSVHFYLFLKAPNMIEYKDDKANSTIPESIIKKGPRKS